MFTSHLKQFLNLLEPDYPYLFTNNENLVGEYSSGYKRAKSNLKVFRKIKKYEDLTDEVKYYKLFVFNTETQTYEVIDRKVCEELTENFGFDYNNDNIDSYEEGDMIDKDSVIYKSTSYDEYMNYSYGRNVCVMYSLDPSTSEDAAVCSKSLTEKFKSIETETIKIGLNTNDFLINLYGDKKHYQPLPKLGQVVSDILVVSRRQFNNQLLFDFRDSSLREIHEGDQIRYTEKDVEIVDYKIYNNNEERYDNPFYEQLNEIMDAQDKYYREILETCEEIINSGYKYSRDIDYLYKRSQEMLDKEKKWRENDTCYGNLELEITIRRVSPLAKGSKITGRYGNKSVISEIRDDEDMPYTKDGRRVDLILNLLAIINRTTSMPITELFITGAAYQVRQHMKELPTLEEKENELFNFIQVFNEKQYDEMYRDYKKLKKKEREQYIQDAIDDGIYIHQLPMWETMPIFYRCQNMLKQFPYIKQDDVYIKKWGREIKVLSKYFIGHQYIL